MLEVYLFVNPIGENCLAAESSVLKLATARHEKVHYQFLPLVNLNTVERVMDRQQLNSHDLNQRNHVFQTIYHAALDYKAALFQGKRKGQQFLMALQQALNLDHRAYSDDLITSLADQAKLDRTMFQEDRRAKLAQESFESDQRIACEMGIQDHPSAVIFNYDNPDKNYGILVEDCTSFQTLNTICDDYLKQTPAPMFHGNLHTI